MPEIIPVLDRDQFTEVFIHGNGHSEVEVVEVGPKSTGIVRIGGAIASVPDQPQYRILKISFRGGGAIIDDESEWLLWEYGTGRIPRYGRKIKNRFRVRVSFKEWRFRRPRVKVVAYRVLGFAPQIVNCRQALVFPTLAKAKSAINQLLAA